MPEPTAMLHTMRASTADLLLELRATTWTDDDLRVESLCEGWTRGHILTHLARNADGIGATLAGALRGEIVARYPDGWDARNAAIETGAGRPIAEQVADVTDSAERLDRVWGAVADGGAWDRPTDQEQRACDWALRRCREVEIHRVDLAGDYTPDRWPPTLIAEQLPILAEELGDRVDAEVTVRVTSGTDLAGRSWTVGAGDPVEVAGPDWAVLAWLVGRPSVAAAALTATPPIAPWR